MAIEYQFLSQSDESLISTSELPVEAGIAVAVRTTGYVVGVDEVVELSIVDFSGNELFSQVVKPQNIDDWTDAGASGAIMPSDVEDAPELFQFEDEIRELFGTASIVVGQHMEFIRKVIEASWIALPDFDEFDVLVRFCASHSAIDYPNQPAAVATLEGIAGYFGLAENGTGTIADARLAANCYLKIVEEHARARLTRASIIENATADDKRSQDIHAARVNAILWLCAAAIFSNLAVQLSLRNVDFAFVAITAAAAIFFAARWIMSLYALHKLRK